LTFTLTTVADRPTVSMFVIPPCLKSMKPEAMQSFEDNFVALPTGYGKSVIFVVLPLLFDYICGKLRMITLVNKCVRLI